MKYIFYKIYCTDNNISNVYIGHTKNWYNRVWHHKKTCNDILHKNYNFPVYKFIRDNGGWDNWVIIPIEEGIYEDIIKVKIREQQLIESFPNNLNKRRAHQTKEERQNYNKKLHKTLYDQNPELFRQKSKEYRNEHKDEISAYNKQYAEKMSEEKKQQRKKISTTRIDA
jgi:hypothetical protein